MLNHSIRIRREVFVRIIDAFWRGALEEEIDRIPLAMRPKSNKMSTRCCLYRDRAILKYRIMAALGVPVESEVDELTTLREYVRMQKTFRTPPKDAPLLEILPEACSECESKHHVVTNACQGCAAQPCSSVCPKQAISQIGGKAVIDREKCVNCGKCTQVCPFSAIICMEPPCQQHCPTGAIQKNLDEKAAIDFSKCIYCGRCITHCPFSAVIDCSDLFFVLQALKSLQHTTAIVAPSLLAQFEAPFEKVLGAVLKAGFDEVLEVAKGAELTLAHEAEEFQERQRDQAGSLMTSSCCASYQELVRKHLPELQTAVSDTPSPMHYTAELARQKRPDTMVIFISPCIAKRREVQDDDNVDLVLTIEELFSLWVALGIDVDLLQPSTSETIVPHAREFPLSGAVVAGLAERVGDSLKPMVINGFDKKTKAKLKMAQAGKLPCNFVEVMACEGGCVGGPCTITSPSRAGQFLRKNIYEK